MKNLGKDIKTVLITKEQIQKRVKELGQEITRDYAGKEVVLVGILKGAMPFLCDLMREIDLPVTLDTMCVSSYGNGTVSSGRVAGLIDQIGGAFGLVLGMTGASALLLLISMVSAITAVVR